METVEIPIFNPSYRGLNGVELVDLNLRAINVYYDRQGTLKKRPAFRPFFFEATPASGNPNIEYGDITEPKIIGHWPSQDWLMLIGPSDSGSAATFRSELGSDGHQLVVLRYNKLELDGAFPTYDGTAFKYSQTLGNQIPDFGQKPVTFAYNDTYFAMAGGGRIFLLESDLTFAEVADTDARTAVTHIDFLDTYLIAMEQGSGTWYFSDVDNFTSWDSLGFATAGGAADHLVALKAFERELFLFGTHTIEIWENDGSTPFSRVPGGLRETGCSAPYAIATNTDFLFFFNQHRKLCAMNGRNIEQLDTNYDTEFAAMDTDAWEDTRMYRTFIEGTEYMMIQMRTKTLLLDVKTQQITEIADFAKLYDYGFYSNPETYREPIINTYAYWPNYNKHLFGINRLSTDPTESADQQYILEWNNDRYIDQHPGATQSWFFNYPIRCELTTGHLDFGTSKIKRSNQTRFRLKRGFYDPNTDEYPDFQQDSPKFQVRWRNDGDGPWSPWQEVSLGDAGEGEITARLHRTGAYRTRQYQFATDANVPLIFLRAEEDIEVLR